MVAETEKVKRSIAKFKFKFNGLSFNMDDAETVTLVYELVGIYRLCFSLGILILVLILVSYSYSLL